MFGSGRALRVVPTRIMDGVGLADKQPGHSQMFPGPSRLGWWSLDRSYTGTRVECAEEGNNRITAKKSKAVQGTPSPRHRNARRRRDRCILLQFQQWRVSQSAILAHVKNQINQSVMNISCLSGRCRRSPGRGGSCPGLGRVHPVASARWRRNPLETATSRPQDRNATRKSKG